MRSRLAQTGSGSTGAICQSVCSRGSRVLVCVTPWQCAADCPSSRLPRLLASRPCPLTLLRLAAGRFHPLGSQEGPRPQGRCSRPAPMLFRRENPGHRAKASGQDPRPPGMDCVPFVSACSVARQAPPDPQHALWAKYRLGAGDGRRKKKHKCASRHKTLPCLLLASLPQSKWKQQ